MTVRGNWKKPMQTQGEYAEFKRQGQRVVYRSDYGKKRISKDPSVCLTIMFNKIKNVSSKSLNCRVILGFI